MDLRSKIQTLFKEAEIYRQQGLYDEAIQKFNNVKLLLHENENIKNRDQLLAALTKKIKVMKAEADEEERALPNDPHAAAMGGGGGGGGNVQDLVKGFFSQEKEQKDKGVSAFKGAIALAQLRQFERALAEFTKLVKTPELRMPAAKNALKCHLAGGNSTEAVEQYNSWLADTDFPDEDIEGIRVYLQELLKKKGEVVELESRAPAYVPPPEPEPELEMPADLDLSEEPSMAPEPSGAAAPTGLVKPKSEIEAMAKAEEAMDEEPIEICSMEITIEEGPAQGQCLELDVTTQRGSRLSLVLPGNEKNFFESLKVGQKLSDVQYFSHFVMFRGTGTVLQKGPITSGGRKGDFTVDIKMDPQ